MQEVLSPSPQLSALGVMTGARVFLLDFVALGGRREAFEIPKKERKSERTKFIIVVEIS